MTQKLQPPTIKRDLFGGHFLSFRRNPLKLLSELSALGDVSAFNLAKIPAFFINHPDLIRDMLVTNHSKFHKGRALQRAKTLLGEGLLTSEESFHLRQRRMIQPAFHRHRIANYGESMIYFAEKMAAEWKEGSEIDIDREMMRLTLWIVGKTLYNADVENEADDVGKAMTTIISMFNIMVLPFSEILENSLTAR